MLFLFTALFANENLEKVSLTVELTSAEEEYITNKNEIKVCYANRDFPFVIEHKDKLEGLAIDYLNVISKKTNIQFKMIKASTGKEKRDFLKKGKCDSVGIIPTDHNTYDFIIPSSSLGTDSIVLVTKLNQPYIFDFKALKNKKIAIRKSAVNIREYVKKHYPNFEIIDAKGLGLGKVLNGEAYGAIASSLKMSYRLMDNFQNDLKIMGIIGDKEISGSLGISSSEPILLSIINKVLSTLSAQEKRDIIKPWRNVKVEKGIDPYLIIKISIILFLLFLIIIVVLIIFKKKLKQEIEKNRQQQLAMLQQSRHAQMGEMISMIAHQWRQPLNSLSMIIQTVSLQHTIGKLNDKLMMELSQDSQEQIKQMSQTIDDFRNYFKPNKESKVFSINAAILNAIKLLKPVFDQHKILIKFDAKEEVFIKGFSNDLGQVLINILNNAKDVLIEKNRDKKKNIHIMLKKENENVVVTIEDNGGGIADDIIGQIFDPYFSTKDEKNGTGLGLYMSKIIIENYSNGRFSVENSDKGAIFKIVLE